MRDRKKEPLFRVLNKMGTESVISDKQYDAFFRQDSAEEGVKAILSAGKFFVNNFPVPVEENEYRVNLEKWIRREGDKWRVERKTYDSFPEATFAIVDRLPAGIDVNVYDDIGDGFADRIEVWCPDSFLAAGITLDDAGMYIIDRGDLHPSVRYSEKDGGAYFGEKPDIRISPENLARDVREGDIVLMSLHPDGWHIERAIEVRGTFMGGEDHRSYLVSGVLYPDAMRFSRGAIIISNRNGEFSNAQKYFGLHQTRKQREVSFWLMKVAGFPNRKGAPIGFTSGENAPYFLREAIEISRQRLEQGRGKAPAEAVWELEEAISRAEFVLSSPESRPEHMDHQVYLLYLTLHGSTEDIGARFAGFRYAGYEQYL